jgi:hypothetical protein
MCNISLARAVAPSSALKIAIMSIKTRQVLMCIVTIIIVPDVLKRCILAPHAMSDTHTHSFQCASCQTAILRQFVEVNRSSRDEAYHLPCHLIQKFWYAKVTSLMVAQRTHPSLTGMSKLPLHSLSRQEAPNLGQQKRRYTHL